MNDMNALEQKMNFPSRARRERVLAVKITIKTVCPPKPASVVCSKQSNHINPPLQRGNHSTGTNHEKRQRNQFYRFEQHRPNCSSSGVWNAPAFPLELALAWNPKGTVLRR